MQTEPEQWAVELWNRAADAADGCATQSFGDDAKAAALTIQRAFEERERKLREVVNELLAAQDAIDNWSAHTEGQEWCEALFRRQRAFLAVSQSLKETLDAQ